MQEITQKSVTKDVNVLVKDAQALFQYAATLTGERADELRTKGMRLLDNALTKAQDAQASAPRAGRQVMTGLDLDHLRSICERVEVIANARQVSINETINVLLAKAVVQERDNVW